VTEIAGATTTEIEVAIALVWRGERVLVTKRLEGAHLGGLWEFPGGKLRLEESPDAAAVREVLEETGVLARARGCRAPIDWRYPERTVRLHPVDCDWVKGEGATRGVAALRWATLTELRELEFPAANATLIAELTRR
jgi:mutator protein MutT